MHVKLPPPTRSNLPIVQKLVATYTTWQTYPRHFPKDLRYTLGEKIDMLFVETIESFFLASTVMGEKKVAHLQQGSSKLDLLKFFLQVAWESHAIDTKKYVHLSEHLEEVGKMLGGWLRQASTNANPAKRGE